METDPECADLSYRGQIGGIVEHQQRVVPMGENRVATGFPGDVEAAALEHPARHEPTVAVEDVEGGHPRAGGGR